MRQRVRPLPVVFGLVVLTAGCASAHRRLPQVLPPATAHAVAGAAIADIARAYLGVPYRAGGVAPTGFDCSGLVWYVLTRNGVDAPRELGRQFEAGAPVSAARVEPGDLVFFSTTGPGPTHVGISLGDGGFIHAPNSRGVVRIDRIGTAYWASRFVGARRLVRPFREAQ
jgi:cell wall-associated NlpC family hydrolase